MTPWRCSDKKTFWATTGMFPQEFVLKLGSTVLVSRVAVTAAQGTLLACTCVCYTARCLLLSRSVLRSTARGIRVERTDGMSPTSWEPLCTLGEASRWFLLSATCCVFSWCVLCRRLLQSTERTRGHKPRRATLVALRQPTSSLSS